MSKMRKLITLLLALTLVFASVVPVAALSDLNSTKTQSSFASASQSPSSMTVYLSIQSDKIGGKYIFRDYFPVYMTSSDYSNNDGICRLGDVLRKAATSNSWLNFLDSSNQVLSNGPSGYVFAISDTSINNGSTIFAASTNYTTRKGWMYRVNRKFPLLDPTDYPSGYSVSTSGPCGAALETTIINAEDKIDLYYADAKASNNAYYTKKVYIEKVNTSLGCGIRVYASYSYYGSASDGNFWYVDTTSKTATTHQYSLVTGVAFDVSVDGGSASSMTTNSDGIIYLNALAGTGSHTVSLLPKFRTTSVTINGVTCYMPLYTGMTITETF